jgi:hypothetical protein
MMGDSVRLLIAIKMHVGIRARREEIADLQSRTKSYKRPEAVTSTPETVIVISTQYEALCWQGKLKRSVWGKP